MALDPKITSLESHRRRRAKTKTELHSSIYGLDLTSTGKISKTQYNIKESGEDGNLHEEKCPLKEMGEVAVFRLKTKFSKTHASIRYL